MAQKAMFAGSLATEAVIKANIGWQATKRATNVANDFGFWTARLTGVDFGFMHYSVTPEHLCYPRELYSDAACCVLRKFDGTRNKFEVGLVAAKGYAMTGRQGNLRSRITDHASRKALQALTDGDSTATVSWAMINSSSTTPTERS